MLRGIISERSTELPSIVIGKLLKMAVEDKSVISLGPGEPDFGTPKEIITAARRALSEGYTHYSPPQGRLELRKAIAEKLKKDNKIDADPDDIIVTTGSTEGILLSLMTMVDPGEGVMITDPGFLAYRPTVEILNGMPLSVQLREEHGWQIDVDELERSIAPEKTNAIIINTPTNPTGTVYTKSALEDLADFAIEHDIMIISDEAYEKLTYDGSKHISIGSLNGMGDRVLTMQSASKTYAMAGFRIGWMHGPGKLVKAMTKLHLFSTLSAPTVSQVAVTAALKGSQKATEEMRKEYDRRRRIMVKRLNRMGLHCVEPKGAFYAFPKISHLTKKSSFKFAEWLLREGKVAVVPGTEFGKHGEGYIRLSYATAYDKIATAMDRMGKALKKL
ncbi:MAG: pyridoxal phosphate-dependent aminotransferase [Candidatus Aenigmarchaeota archaeon]